MRELHPNVQAALAMTRELGHRVDEMMERADDIYARRPSPSGLVIPEVDAMGRLLDLFLAPGTCDRLDGQQLVADIMAAITESTRDAKRRYHVVMNDPDDLPRPIEDAVREWQARTVPNQQVPNFGKAEQ